MDKLTYTILTKDGEDFKTFGFGGYNLTAGKTLAQSLVDGASKEKARKLGFYAACVALVDLAKRAGYQLSSKISIALSDEGLYKSVIACESAVDEYARERNILARLAKTSERLHTIREFGGRIEEIDARLAAHAKAVAMQRATVYALKAEMEKARAAMFKEEERVWSSLRSDAEKKNNNEQATDEHANQNA